jgi:hypothetical protein
MPPGNARPKPTARVLERTTAKTCLAISQRIQADCQSRGDQTGMETARQISELIQQEVLVPEPERAPLKSIARAH